jgi:hypothetical protein
MSKMKRISALVLAGCFASTASFAVDPVPAKEKPSSFNSFRNDLAALEPAQEVELIDDRILAAGLGAIGGVLTFNLMTGGLGGLPFFYA